MKAIAMFSKRGSYGTIHTTTSPCSYLGINIFNAAMKAKAEGYQKRTFKGEGYLANEKATA